MGQRFYMKFDAADERKLRTWVQCMTPRTKVYRVLKQELKARGWWKNRVRGRHARRNDERQTN